MNSCRLPDANWPFLAALTLTCASTLLALEPGRSLTQYGLDRWGAENGLPQDKVQGITQTPDGYLWIGTLHGLAKFDGARFTPFHPADAPELESVSVHGLYAAKDGSLWIGTDFDGLAHWKNGHVEWYRSQQPFATEIRCIREDRNGTIWITAQEGVFRVSGHTLVPEALNLLRVFDLAPDPRGGIWVGAERGLFHLPGNGHRLDPWKDASGPAGWIFAVLPLGDGRLWAGGGGGLALMENGRWTTYSERDGLPNKWIRCLLEDSHGSIWAGTFGGLARFTKGKLDVLTVKDGLSDREVASLFEDREGSLWIGTRGGGMTRLRDVPAITFNLASGNTRNPTTPFEDAEGRLWSGADDGAVLQYRDGGWIYRRYPELTNRQITYLSEDSTGALMVIAGARLFRLSNGAAKRIALPGCPPELPVISLAPGPGRSLWIVGDGNRLFHLSHGHFESITIDEDKFGQIDQVFVSPRGGMWAIGSTGVVRVEDSIPRLFWKRPTSLRGDLLNLLEDPDGSVWVGTEGNGILHLGAGPVRDFARRDGLPDDSIMDMLADDDGNLWIGSQSGIFRVAKSEMRSLSGRIHADSYTTLDGLQSNSFEVGNTRGALRRRNGQLWFASSHGLTMLDPAKIHRNKLVPAVFIESVTVDGQEVTRESPVKPPGNGDVSIRYAATSLLQPLRVRFHLKLDGFDEKWSRETSTREVTYTNLPPGHYVFRVRGSNNDGLWNPVETAQAFQIQPRFYQTWWFRLSGLLTALAVIWASVQWRMRQLRSTKENLDRVVQEQTGLLRDANRKLMQLSRLDGLTGVANRRHFDECLDHEFKRSGRSGLPLSLLMVDIDHFKILNDTRGHPEGDACLARLAAILNTVARRESDVVARYGGEEFAIILPELDSARAVALADDILTLVRNASIANPSSPLEGVLTVSVGVATVQREQVESARSIVSFADEALYRAKRAGRNRAEIAVISDGASPEIADLDRDASTVVNA